MLLLQQEAHTSRSERRTPLGKVERRSQWTRKLCLLLHIIESVVWRYVIEREIYRGVKPKRQVQVSEL